MACEGRDHVAPDDAPPAAAIKPCRQHEVLVLSERKRPRTTRARSVQPISDRMMVIQK